MSFVQATFVALGLALVANGFSMEGDASHRAYKAWYVAPLTSLKVLGTEERRIGVMVGYQAVRPEKRFQINGQDLNLVMDYYAAYTHGSGVGAARQNAYYQAGFLGMARYERIGPSGDGFYFDAGWGFTFVSDLSIDLDTHINSTPVVDFGAILNRNGASWQVGIRLFHISNGGTNKPNRGQNQVMFMIGMRY